MKIKEFFVRAWFAGMLCYISFYLFNFPGQYGYLITSLAFSFFSIYIIDIIINAWIRPTKNNKKTKITIGIISLISALIPYLLHLVILIPSISKLIPFDTTIVEPISYGLITSLSFMLLFSLFSKKDDNKV